MAKSLGQSESLQEQTVGSWRLEDRLCLWLAVHPDAVLKGPLSMQEPSHTHRAVLTATLYYCHSACISQGLINNCTRWQWQKQVLCHPLGSYLVNHRHRQVDTSLWNRIRKARPQQMTLPNFLEDGTYFSEDLVSSESLNTSNKQPELLSQLLCSSQAPGTELSTQHPYVLVLWLPLLQH